MAWVSAILALSVPIVIVVGYLNRRESGKGIGWQFIRYTVLGIALPIAAILALNNSLSEGAAAIIAGAMGYAFGKTGDDGNAPRP